jgi:hypothetical protein
MSEAVDDPLLHNRATFGVALGGAGVSVTVGDLPLSHRNRRHRLTRRVTAARGSVRRPVVSEQLCAVAEMKIWASYRHRRGGSGEIGVSWARGSSGGWKARCVGPSTFQPRDDRAAPPTLSRSDFPSGAERDKEIRSSLVPPWYGRAVALSF